VLSPDGELQLHPDVPAVHPDVPVHGDPLQHGLVRDDSHRRAALLRGDLLVLQLLHGLPARAAHGLDRAAEIRAVPHVGRHRAVGQQHPRRVRSPVQHAKRVHADAEVPHRSRRRRMGGKEVPSVGRRAAARRAGARSLLHGDGVLCAGERDLRDRAVPGAVPGRVPVHGAPLHRPAVRGLRSGRGRSRAGSSGFMKARVAVLRVTPEGILSDIDRLVDLAGVSAALAGGSTTILKDNISWHFPFPAANTTPWQLEGTIQALARRGFVDQVCVQNKTVVTNAFRGEDLNHYVPIFQRYDVPVLYNFKDTDMKWVAFEPKARMRVLKRIFPEGIHVPDFFFGKNIVHLPTTKCHIYTTTTGAMKNAFGGLLNTRRHYTHSWIHETLVDLLAIQKEIHAGLFAIMDGTTAGNGPGPRTMYPVVKNVMLASADQVAIDAVSARMMGFDPMSIGYIRLAHEDGLGVGDPRDIEIVGDVDAARENWNFRVGRNL